MFRKISFVVWSAFTLWMVVFLFSLRQADASTLSTIPLKTPHVTVDDLDPENPKIDQVQKLLNSYVDFLCSKFDASLQCSKPLRDKIELEAHHGKNFPLSTDGVRAYTLNLTVNACMGSGMIANGATDSRLKCFQGADRGLSLENIGNHWDCNVKNTSFVWSIAQQVQDKNVECYRKAFSKDAEEAQKIAASDTPVDPSIAAFRKIAKNYCHGVENFKPGEDLKNIPKQFKGLVLRPVGPCQEVAAKWADQALKLSPSQLDQLKTQPDSDSPLRSEAETKFLIYDMVHTLCLDKTLVAHDPQFTEKCFYATDLRLSGFTNAPEVNYSKCLTTSLTASADKSQKTEAEKTMAMVDDLSGFTQNSSSCFVSAFEKDFQKVMENYKSEKLAEHDKTDVACSTELISVK